MERARHEVIPRREVGADGSPEHGGLAGADSPVEADEANGDRPAGTAVALRVIHDSQPLARSDGEAPRLRGVDEDPGGGKPGVTRSRRAYSGRRELAEGGYGRVAKRWNLPVSRTARDTICGKVDEDPESIGEVLQGHLSRGQVEQRAAHGTERGAPPGKEALRNEPRRPKYGLKAGTARAGRLAHPVLRGWIDIRASSALAVVGGEHLTAGGEEDPRGRSCRRPAARQVGPHLAPALHGWIGTANQRPGRGVNAGRELGIGVSES